MSAAAMARRSSPLPSSFRIELAPSTRLVNELLIGGDPGCVVRLQGPTLACFHMLAGGTAVGAADPSTPRGADAQTLAGALARRLVDAGLAHPVPHGPSPRRDDVTVVVPVHNGATRLACLMDGIGTVARLVVVDDGSSDATAVTAARLGATVVRHEQALGPAAARNSGLAEVTTSITMFLDDDTILEPGWDVALTHFADPAVGAVVPRIKSSANEAEPTVAARYQLARPPYDLGTDPGLLAHHTRLGSGGGAVVFARTDAVRDLGGFDATLRYGEDVDLFWSLADADWRVRYEPQVTATHGVRSEVSELLRVHLRYGGGDADLTRRHGHRSGGTMSASAIAGAALVGAARPRLAAAVLAAQTTSIAVGLVRAGLRPALAARLAAAWQISSLRTIAAIGTSTALPLTVAAAAWVPRLRPLVATAVLGRHLEGWRRARAQIGPITWVGMRLADDTAHALGTWIGMAKLRDVRTLLPTLTRPLVDGPTADARYPIAGWTTVAELR